MATRDKEVARLRVKERLVLYTTPVLASVVLTIFFWQLSLHQSRLQEMENFMKDSIATLKMQRQVTKDVNLRDHDLLLRYTRNDESAEGVQTLNDYFGKIAEQQVR